jgi:hypothetical protein
VIKNKNQTKPKQNKQQQQKKKTTTAKSNLERKGFIRLTLPHLSPSSKEVETGTQGRILEAELNQNL